MGILELPYGCEITVIAQEGLKTVILVCYLSKLNLPTLLFRVGLLTLINMDSLRASPSRHDSPQGSSPLEEPNPKWVINLSSKPLTTAQRSVLAKGPNFAVLPKHPPKLEYITAIGCLYYAKSAGC